MYYDFETLINRSELGSSKWLGMIQKKPNVSKEIVPFSVADMEFKNAPEIIEGLKEYLDETILGYTSPTENYLDSVVNFMNRHHNWEIDKSWIVTAPGVVPALAHAIRGFTNPGDGVIIMTPVYYPFFACVTMNNRVIVENPLVDNEGHYEINFEDLELKASNAKNKILLFCSPHNPIGRVWTKDELEKVAAICLKHDVLIISDEIHFDLIMPGYEHTVMATLSDEVADKCIVCTAPSKTFNLAGMQTSNLVIKNENLRERMKSAMLEVAFLSCGTLGYKACELAYTRCDLWLEELIMKINENKNIVEEFCKEHIPEIKVYPLEGTYLQWLDLRAFGLNNEELEKAMIEDCELFFDEGYIFGEAGTGFERINIACPTDVLLEGLRRLAKWAETKRKE
ncbi:MalY/PatB family protein [Anaerorhabdus sp.]|uniref:MalY/PatB family protein n=1 Tax=Anaerorhabdus sp. TaxID=1872524 RepID=UPI002B1FF4A0|nr:MalY/PatB family protein [Anaerorhabdus sp.]MEA4874857.1 MalY/PatB family protein [Anaerorhabdus sp.]